MLGGIAFFGGLIGITGGIVWTLFNQRRIWVGKWKSKSVIITVEGRTIRLMIDKKEVFVGKAWNKEGVFELQFQDEDQGECSGVLLVQHVPNGETRTFIADLILDGEAISLIQPPSSIFNQPSLDQAEMIFRAKSAIKNAPVQNVQWDEILNLCKNIRDVNQENSEVLAAVEVLQGELRQNFDMVDRMERAANSYEQLGGVDESFDDLCKKVQQQQDNLLDLLKNLHTSTLSIQITQKTSENTAIKNILERIHAEIEIEERLQEDPSKETIISKEESMEKKKKAQFIHHNNQRNL